MEPKYLVLNSYGNKHEVRFTNSQGYSEVQWYYADDFITNTLPNALQVFEESTAIPVGEDPVLDPSLY